MYVMHKPSRIWGEAPVLHAPPNVIVGPQMNAVLDIIAISVMTPQTGSTEPILVMPI